MISFFKKHGLALLVLIGILYFPIFWQLPKMPLSIWDEARVGVNALEIDGFKKMIAPHYGAIPDMFSLKPPLLPVLQRICMEIIGYDVLGVRLPSALATFGICILFIGFCYRKYGTLWPGTIASLVIVTTPGFMRDHIAWTGDYDALLCFFMTAYTLFYFAYLKNPSKKRNLYFAGAAIIFGVLTKGVAALIPLPGLLIYTLLNRKAAAVFRSRDFYVLVAFFVLIVGAVYGLREYYTLGYLELVFEGELLTVPTVPVAEHHGPWWYYVDVTLFTGFSYFTASLLMGIISGFKGPFRDKLLPFLLAYLASYFIVISAAATKTLWYDAPFYPIAALAAGIFIYKILTYFVSYLADTGPRNTVYMFGFTALIFLAPYQNILRYHWNMPHSDWDMLKYEDYMKKLRREKPELNTYTVVGKGYNPQMLFFTEAFRKDGMALSIKNVRETLTPGETVLCCEQGAIDDLKKTYRFTYIHKADPCMLVKITGHIDSLQATSF
jgi:4-amino-4-deoxy-L-arabinose transferase-like glycosyltransferase